MSALVVEATIWPLVTMAVMVTTILLEMSYPKAIPQNIPSNWMKII
jgi:hypothetical protein